MNTIESNVAMRRVSRILQWVGGFTSRSSVAATMAIVMLAFLVSRFPHFSRAIYVPHSAIAVA